MSKVYIRLLVVAAFLIAVTGAFFSVAGLTKLFAGAAKSVALMAASLEFAKLVVTGFLYRYWGHINRVMRVYLVFAVITLVGITSVGIYGYLSNAYQMASMDVKSQSIKIKALQAEDARLQARAAELRKFVEAIPDSRISRRFEFQDRYEPEFNRLRRRSDAIANQINKLRVEMLKSHTELGPLSFLAELMGWDPDSIVNGFILVFVAVFDPLAVCLVFCLNLAIRLREKYRGNEVKISAHAMSTPVDHRFRRGKDSGKKAA